MGHNQHLITDPLFNYIVLEAFEKFRLPKRVAPIHLNDIFEMPLEIRKSSAGFPWSPLFKTRGEVMDDPSARNSIRWFWHRVKDGEKLNPPDCKVLYRAHLEDSGSPKIRAVYGYPTTITLGEACFAIPLIEGFKQHKTPLAYGYDMLLGGARKLRSEIKGYKNHLCMDYKGFDKTVSSQLIELAFSILLQNLDFTQYREQGTPDLERLVNMFTYIKHYFIQTPMRLYNGERYKKTAGIPSGSYFTQLVGSIVNWIITTYSFTKVVGRMPDYLRVFGDDSVLSSNSTIPKYLIAEVIENLGMMCNLNKTLLTTNVDDVEFLGFKITNGFPQRKFRKWLELLYNPERPDDSWDMFASRALGLFYANHGIDSRFSFMCRNVVNHRPFTI
ncbi:hypothetical protein 1, partial [Canna indica partitivirus]